MPATAAARTLILGLAALGLAACSGLGPVPDELLSQDSTQQLELHAQAVDGCGFAGTWQYEQALPDGEVSGVAVLQYVQGELEGMHRFKAEEKTSSSATVTCPYETCDLCPAGFSCTRGFYITAGVEDHGRAAAGASVNPTIGSRWTRFLLSDDGQTLAMSFWSPLRYLTVHARKTKAVGCEAQIDYVREAARWANNGYPVPVFGVD